jgi:hypothetical protein
MRASSAEVYHEHAVTAGHEVLVDRAAGERSPQTRVVCLQTLSLSERIVGRRDKAFHGKIRGDILYYRLALVPMSQRYQNTGISSCLLGTVHVGP